jgi:hypothetical protein
MFMKDLLRIFCVFINAGHNLSDLYRHHIYNSKPSMLYSLDYIHNIICIQSLYRAREVIRLFATPFYILEIIYCSGTTNLLFCSQRKYFNYICI